MGADTYKSSSRAATSTPVASLGLQKAGVESVALLEQLHEEIFPSGERWNAASFASLLSVPGTEAWISVEGEHPAALLLTRVLAGEGEVLTLGVRPAYRRVGHARGLLQGFLAQVACERVLLEVSAQNNGAALLYRHCGFQPIGHRKSYYPDGSDAVVMEWTLSK